MFNFFLENIMSEIQNYNHAHFCWLDLGTFNMDAASEFYSALFNWEILRNNSQETGQYSMFLVNQKPVAGFYPLMQEQIDNHVPSHWMPYIKTDNIAETVSKAKENGANIIADVMTVPNEGSMALIQDSEGGMFGLWQPLNHIGSAYKDIPGAMCWFEYGCHNREKSIEFYQNVFGWSNETSQMGETLYTTFLSENGMVGGLYELPENMQEIPNHWLSYFATENIDKCCEIVTQKDGNIIMPKMFVPGVGFFAVIQDSQGAVFGIVQGQ